jgi:hypothetical protein
MQSFNSSLLSYYFGFRIQSGAAFDEVVLRLTDVVPTVGLSTDVFSASSTSAADHYHGSFSTRRFLQGAAADLWQRRVCVHTLKIYLEMVLKSLPIAAKSQRTMVSDLYNFISIPVVDTVVNVVIVDLVVLLVVSLFSVILYSRISRQLLVQYSIGTILAIGCASSASVNLCFVWSLLSLHIDDNTWCRSRPG